MILKNKKKDDISDVKISVEDDFCLVVDLIKCENGEEYPVKYVIQIDMENLSHSKESVLKFDLIDERGKMFGQKINLIAENVINDDSIDEFVRKFVAFFYTDSVEGLEKNFGQDPEFGVLVDKVKELLSDPKMVKKIYRYGKSKMNGK